MCASLSPASSTEQEQKRMKPRGRQRQNPLPFPGMSLWAPDSPHQAPSPHGWRAWDWASRSGVLSEDFGLTAAPLHNGSRGPVPGKSPAPPRPLKHTEVARPGLARSLPSLRVASGAASREAPSEPVPPVGARATLRRGGPITHGGSHPTPPRGVSEL